MRVLSSLVICSMLFSIINLSVAYTYFTSVGDRESEGFTFLVFEQKKDSNINADVSLSREFLFEEEERGFGDGEDTITTKNFSMEAASMNDDGIQSHDVGQSPESKYIAAEISMIGQDFHVEDIFTPSVKLHYEDRISFALSVEILEGILVANFDIDEVQQWFQNASLLPDYVTLEVSGEGYDEDTVVFFRGATTIPLKGTYDVIDITDVELPIPESKPIENGENEDSDSSEDTEGSAARKEDNEVAVKPEENEDEEENEGDQEPEPSNNSESNDPLFNNIAPIEDEEKDHGYENI